MEDLTQVLTVQELERLRGAYSAATVIDLKVQMTAAVYPPLGPWADAIGDAFFRGGPLAPRERELCILSLLAFRAPGLSLGTHVYAGLMEGLSVAQICQAVGISGAYGGLPAYTEAMTTIRTTLGALKHAAAGEAVDARTVFVAMLAAFSGKSKPG